MAANGASIVEAAVTAAIRAKVPRRTVQAVADDDGQAPELVQAPPGDESARDPQALPSRWLLILWTCFRLISIVVPLTQMAMFSSITFCAASALGAELKL